MFNIGTVVWYNWRQTTTGRGAVTKKIYGTIQYIDYESGKAQVRTLNKYDVRIIPLSELNPDDRPNKR